MLACWRQLGADHDRCAKHLPFTELFLQEAVKNNILGSRLLANFDFHGYQRGQTDAHRVANLDANSTLYTTSFSPTKPTQ